MTLTDFRINPDGVKKATGPIRSRADSVSHISISNLDPGMFGSLAGAAAQLAEPRSSEMTRHMAHASADAGRQLADDVVAAAAAYAATEKEAIRLIDILRKGIR